MRLHFCDHRNPNKTQTLTGKVSFPICMEKKWLPDRPLPTVRPPLLLLLLVCLRFACQGASGIELTMSVTSQAAAPGSSIRMDCRFRPAAVYVFWRFSPDAGATWQKAAICHTESGLCNLQEPLATAWAAARPAAFVNGSLALGSVGREQDGVFECEGIGGTDAAKANRSLTVLVAPSSPTIRTAGSGAASATLLTVSESEAVALSCSTSGGNPPPAVSWLRKRRGQAASFERLPANSAVWTPPAAKFGIGRSDLRLPASSADNLAEFACRSEHQLVNATSASVTVAVLYRPKVAPVSSQMVLIGDRVEFNCSADANPSAKVYFVRGNYTVSAIGQQSVWHAIPSAGKSDSGSYACAADNPLGTGRSEFYLDVQYPPEITIQGSPSVREGGRLVLDCLVSANPPPYLVQWLHESSGGAPAAPAAAAVAVVLNASRLVLDPVSRADAGQWTCRARSSTATTASAAAASQIRREFAAQASADLIVEYAPGSPEIRLSGSRVIAGQPASLVCQPSPTDPGVPVPSFVWTKFGNAGAPLTSGPILQLQPVSLADNGVYYCTPENGVGRGPTASVALEVVQPPVWLTAWPSGDSGVITLNLTTSQWQLDCSALAKPEAQVRWFKDGVEVDPADFTVVSSYDSATYRSLSVLKFSGPSRGGGGRLRPSDNGEFLCTAQNSFGKIDRTLQIVIEFAPIILTDTAKLALGQADSAGLTLECLVDSQPEPTVTWELRRDGTAHVGNLMREPQPPYQYRATLPGVRETGGFTCRARNRLGERSHVIEVVTPGAPEAPRNVSVVSTGWNHVLLSWLPGFNGGLPAAFSVAFASTSDVSRFGLDGPHVGEVSASSYTGANVTDLFPTTSYAFAVRASNSLGRSAATANESSSASARTADLRLPDVGGIRVIGESTLSYATPQAGLCVRVDISADGGTVWSVYRKCEVGGQLSGLNLAKSYRLSLCLVSRQNVCGPTVTTQSISNLPEVSGLTIAVVASGCALLILCLILVLIFFCCRNRHAKTGGSSDSSDQFSHRDASSVERKVMNYMQYDTTTQQQHQQQTQQLHLGITANSRQQQFAMVSPHPSLTSTDETSVDQGSGSKVFATLVSANNPVAIHIGTHNESSGSDHSGSLLHTSRQTSNNQRKIIYEVVV